MIKQITEATYEQFNIKNEHYNFFQTAKNARARTSIYEEVQLLGLYVNEELVATTLLLIEHLPRINAKVGYVIMGIVIDYTRQDLLDRYVVEMKEYSKLQKLLYIRYDFDIYTEQFDRDFNPTAIDPQINHCTGIADILTTAGFKFKPIAYDYFGRSPQWTMITYTNDQESINKQINRSVKRGIKTAKNAGCEIACFENANDLDPLYNKSYLEIFYDLHLNTAKHSDFVPANFNYFKAMYDENDPNVKIYLVKLKKDAFLTYAREQVAKKDSPKNQQLMTLAESITQEYIYITAHMSAFYNRTGFDLFTGLNYSYNAISPKELIMEQIFSDCLELKILNYDYWGIIGKVDEEHYMHSIYKFKSKFSNVIIHKPGFYDLYNNKLEYLAITKLMDLRSKLKH